ncbi:glycosyltransferase [Microbacterium sp. LRZ72]|uniref:glycosyltransferase n=1 Tax=Microbacterium sp. LRZ72 TaxID=2942481 RepID=UPI0029AD99D0|nr:glycosyltransferase [Microbacterium sp. LRZ72]MDX2377019.1 glycosyltransferase [Microbacterium sp. LRZ72]
MTANVPHVLVVASTFPSGPSDTVPRFVLDQVVALRRIRPTWRFTVLAPHDARSGTVDRRQHEEFLELRFHYARPRRWEKLAGHGIMPAIRRHPALIFFVPALLWSEYRAIRRVVREDRPDLIYAHWFTPQAMAVAPVAWRARLPFVFTTHASDVAIWGRFGIAGKIVVRSVSRAAKALTAVSETSLLRMRRFFPDDEWTSSAGKRAVIPMGIDLAVPDVGGASNSFPGERVVLFVGRLAEKKGVRYLIEAFAAVRADTPDVRLVVVGDGPLRRVLENQAAVLGDCIEFAGYRTGAEKERLLQRADVVVVPSIVAADGDAEGMPVALLEALARGKATIATESSNAGEIDAPPDAVVMCADADADALARAMREVLAWPDDRRAAASLAARRAAEQFAWPDVAERTAQFLLDPYLDSRR